MRNRLYFYRKTTYPTDADYYNITKGYAGYRTPQAGEPLFSGTVEEFEDWLDTRRRPCVRVSKRGEREGVRR